MLKNFKIQTNNFDQQMKSECYLPKSSYKYLLKDQGRKDLTHNRKLFNDFKNGSYIILFFTIALYIIYIISILSYPGCIFSADGDGALIFRLLFPGGLIALQIGCVCQINRGSYLSSGALGIFFGLFNVIIIEFAIQLLGADDLFFTSMFISCINMMIISRLSNIYQRMFLMCTMGAYYLLRRMVSLSVFGYFAWALVVVFQFINENNTRKMMEGIISYKDHGNKELKQIKRALQAIPDGVAIIFDDLITYSNPSIREHFKTKKNEGLLESIQSIIVTERYYEEEHHVDYMDEEDDDLLISQSGALKLKRAFDISPDNELKSEPTPANSKPRTNIQLDVSPKKMGRIREPQDFQAAIRKYGPSELEYMAKAVEEEVLQENERKPLKTILEMILNSERSTKEIDSQNLDSEGKTITFRNCQYIKKNSTKIFDVKIRKIKWNDTQTALLVIVVDQTVRSNMENLKKANKFKEAVLTYVSHEIRTPLNTIIQNLNTLKDSCATQIIETFIEPSISSANFLLSTLVDIDFINKIDNKQFYPPLSTFNLRKLIDDVYNMFFKMAKEKNLTLAVRVHDQVPNNISSYHTALKQLLMNIISNAIKYTFTGSVIIEVNPHPNLKNILLFTIEDTGIGIKEHDLKKIGEVFSKQKQSSSEIFQNTGIGLGLYLSKYLAKVLEPSSTLGITSSVGRGSIITFLVRTDVTTPLRIGFNGKIQSSECQPDEIEEVHNLLPYGTDTHPPSKQITYEELRSPDIAFEAKASFFSNASKLALENPEIMQGSSLLEVPEVFIVDDSPLSVLALKSLLATQGMKIIAAGNGEMAIEKIRNKEIDFNKLKFIIMDINMPVMDGIECTKILRGMMQNKAIPQIPIIVSSAAVDDPKLQGLFDGVLPKPVDKKTLMEFVKKYR